MADSFRAYTFKAIGGISSGSGVLDIKSREKLADRSVGYNRKKASAGSTKGRPVSRIDRENRAWGKTFGLVTWVVQESRRNSRRKESWKGRIAFARDQNDRLPVAV